MTKHNSKFHILCDWIESSAFFQAEVTKSDLVDELIDNKIYDTQDFAYETVNDAWSELRKRIRWLGIGSHIRITGDSVMPNSGTWTDFPQVAFCLMLAANHYYSNLNLSDSGSYVKQGDLFELLVNESLVALGWEVFRTGWASGIQQSSFEAIVKDVADELAEPYFSDDVAKLYQHQKDLGLDLVCYSTFADQNERCAKPVYFIQCASGDDWKDKIATPDIQLWGKIIQFSNLPTRGFAIPITFDDNNEFWRYALKINGVVLDRSRILSPSKTRINWISDDLRGKLISWVGARVGQLSS